jgi:hypothetical protein
MDSWLAWGYHVCGNSERYAASAARIQAAIDRDPAFIDAGFMYYYALEGDTEKLVDMVGRVVDSRNPLTPFMQIFLLDYLGWGVSKDMPTNPRYLSILKELDFPPHDPL